MTPQQLARLHEALEPRLGALKIFLMVKNELVKIPSIKLLPIYIFRTNQGLTNIAIAKMRKRKVRT